MEKFDLKNTFGGGGKLGDASLEPKTEFEAAKQLGSEAAKRNLDAKSVTENTKSILAPMAGEEAIVHERLVSVTSAGAGELVANSGDEHESIVGWGCEIADEWLTRGARNEIHICDSNMNGSSEREAISRRYPNNENHDNSCNSRHSEGNSNFIPKNLLLSNQKIDNSRNSRHSERQRTTRASYLVWLVYSPTM